MSILTSIDDIQLILEDHIIKAQTMKGSPFVKPFEKEMNDWEWKLMSMQQITDNWLNVCYISPFNASCSTLLLFERPSAILV